LVINPDRRNDPEDLLPMWGVGVKIDMNDTGLEKLWTALDWIHSAQHGSRGGRQ
jgi:hypothetical protein